MHSGIAKFVFVEFGVGHPKDISCYLSMNELRFVRVHFDSHLRKIFRKHQKHHSVDARDGQDSRPITAPASFVILRCKALHGKNKA